MKKLIFLALLAPAAAWSAAPTPGPYEAALSWGAPTMYTDGTTIPATVALTYNLYIWDCAGSTVATPTISGVTGLAYTATNQPAGKTMCYQVSVVAEGQESGRSGTGQKTFPNRTPAGTTITVR